MGLEGVSSRPTIRKGIEAHWESLLSTAAAQPGGSIAYRISLFKDLQACRKLASREEALQAKNPSFQAPRDGALREFDRACINLKSVTSKSSEGDDYL